MAPASALQTSWTTGLRSGIQGATVAFPSAASHPALPSKRSKMSLGCMLPTIDKDFEQQLLQLSHKKSKAAIGASTADGPLVPKRRSSKALKTLELTSSPLPPVAQRSTSAPLAPTRKRSASVPCIASDDVQLLRTQAAQRRGSCPACPQVIDFRLKSNEPRDVALIRLILHAARKRHQQRPSYKARSAEREEATGTSGACSLWRLSQSKQILREVVQDVAAAAKSCSRANACVKVMQKAAEECGQRQVQQKREAEREAEQRKSKSLACISRFQRVRSKIAVAQALDNSLSEIRKTESDWWELQKSMALKTKWIF